MKKQIFLLAALLMTGVAVQAQVGVGTDDPKATMEIVGETTANVPDGVLIPRFSVTELAAKDAAYGTDQNGALVFVISGVGSAGKTSNITGPGFHYYDSTISKWVVITGSVPAVTANNGLTKTGNNIELGGSLTKLTTISGATATNKFAITGTGLDAINFDSNTFSIDAQNNRVGIGTTTPQGRFTIQQDGNSQESFIIKNPLAENRITAGTWGSGQGFLRIYGNGNLANEPDISMSASGSWFKTGFVGIGTMNPTNQLHLNAANPLRMQGVVSGSVPTDLLLGVDNTGVVKTLGTGPDLLASLSVPVPAIFSLSSDITNFLSPHIFGESQIFPMTLVKNSIPGLTYNAGTGRVSLPPGTYQITFVYEASHNIDCTISSYFFDFPSASGIQRIHSTASHNTFGLSNHAGTISFTTVLPSASFMDIHLGRGQSGNCMGPGMILVARSTHMIITRYGGV